MRRRARTLRRGVAVLFSGLLWAAVSGQGCPATDQIAQARSQYWTRIDIVDATPDTAQYAYDMFGRDSSPRRGHVEILDRVNCRELNPWWGPGLPVQRDTWCDLWIGSDAFEELLAEGRTRFDVDSYFRQDNGLVLERVGTQMLRIRVDGRATQLPVVEVKSTAGDQLWIYDDRDNPFVLAARVQDVYNWHVTDIFVERTPPPPGEAPATLHQELRRAPVPPPRSL